MAPVSLTDIIAALPSEDSWGPPTSTETTLNGVPYAPYSKGDKLGRMADWTTEGKDGRDGRGGRQQYNRNYRGLIFCLNILPHICHIQAWVNYAGRGNLLISEKQINKSTVPVHPPYSLYNSPKMNLPSPLSAILATRRRQDLAGVEHSREGGVNVADAAIPEVDVDSFRELEDEEASKVTTTMISEEAAEVRVVDGDLAGRITTSHSATAMRLLTSSLTGRCWRRLTSTAWLS